MSEPQMVDDFVFTKTSPWPGVGTSNSFSSTVLLPGSIAPCIFFAIFHILSDAIFITLYLSRGYLAI